VDKFFKTLSKLASSSVFLLGKSENNWPKIKGKGEGKNLARLASEFVFLLANPEFYSRLVSWRVVIRTPVILILSVTLHDALIQPQDNMNM
jgi:hypothetical protein